MATPIRKTLTPEQRDQIAVILHGEIRLWVDRFGADLVREILHDVTSRASTDPEPPPASAAVLAFPRRASTTDVLAGRD